MQSAKLTFMLLVAAGLTLGLSAVYAETREKRADKKTDRPFKNVRVAVLTGEGFHDAETLMPLAYLTNRGANVTVIGPESKQIKAYNSDISLFVEKSVTDVKAKDFDMLILPGGRAPALIRQNDNVLKFTRDFYELGKPIAAICHGPQVLISAGVVEGRKMTCVSSVADEVREAGATYHDQEVLRDGNLITSRVPKDIPAWLAEIEALLMETHQ